MKKASLFKLPAGQKHKYLVRIHTKNGKKKTVKFGENGSEDFTIHKDRRRRLLYLDRHGRDKPSFSKSTKENWGQDGIYTAGYWSRWLLWEKPSIGQAIRFMRDKKNIDIDY